MAKAKKIYSTDTDALNEAIREAEGRATARTIDAEEVNEKLKRAETMMNWPPKKALAGTKIHVHASTQKLPNAYKYKADSTQVLFEHDGKGWKFVCAGRYTLKQSSDSSKIGVEIEASEATKEHMLSYIKFC